MGLAQGLYEGQDVGEGGTTGLITYMRTDSTNIAEVARNEVRAYIAQRYGNDFLPEKAPEYTKKVAGAQEAHEAIRPTSVLRDPEKVKPFLDPAMFKLYQLIWQRFVASQMEAAVYDTLSVDVTGQGSDHVYTLRAAGSAVKFPGFLIVYEEAKDEDKKSEEEDEMNVRIPASIAEGQTPGFGAAYPGAALYPAPTALFGSLTWCRFWKSTALDAHPHTPRRFRQFSSAAMWNAWIAALFLPKQASWSMI